MTQPPSMAPKAPGSPAQTPKRAPDYETLAAVARAAGLSVYGAFHPGPDTAGGLAGGTMLLLGTGPGYWDVLTAAPEYLDTNPDPVDRWSARVVGDLAAQFGAAAHFPFGGPPYAPFIAWALASGRAFTSPSQMLVHDEYGMLISFRGALHFMQEFDIPEPPLAASPCTSCTAQPCLSACPAGALVDGGPYQVAACHSHLDTPDGQSCLSQGCLARLACPLSSAADRPFAQTAHHMRYFHTK